MLKHGPWLKGLEVQRGWWQGPVSVLSLGPGLSGWWPGLELGLDSQRLFLYGGTCILPASTFQEENIYKNRDGGGLEMGMELWARDGLG